MPIAFSQVRHVPNLGLGQWGPLRHEPKSKRPIAAPANPNEGLSLRKV